MPENILERYTDVFREVIGEPIMCDIIAGRMSFPHHGPEDPFEEPVDGLQPPGFTYEGPFPPALIPFYSSYFGSVTGYWKHWLIERQTVIVGFSGQGDFGTDSLVVEEARSLKQFAAYDIMYAISDDEGIEATTAKFAEMFGIDAKRIEHILLNGQMEEGLVHIPLFQEDPPCGLIDFEAPYDGDFPNHRMELTPDTLRKACMYEIHSHHTTNRNVGVYDFREKVMSLDFAPPWLRTTNQKECFEKLMDDGDLVGAWMSLNSKGWKTSDAATAIRELADAAQEDGLSMVADAWLSMPFQKKGDRDY